MSDAPDWGAPCYRDALLQRARTLRTDPRLRSKFDVEDLVNETLARAVAAQAGTSPFRGTTENEKYRYLFTIQSHLLRDWFDAYLNAEARSVKREQDLQAFDQAISDSLDGLVNLAADQTSPSEKAVRNEREAWLDRNLAQLPEREREAMTRRFKQNQTLAQIGEAMGISEYAAGSLITRATARLQKMNPENTSGD